MRTWYFKNSEPVLDAKGNIKIIEGVESLSENINQRLKLFRGKYFMDTSKGVPYFEQILTKPIDPDLIASIFNAEILLEPEVNNIREVTADLNRDSRKFSYSAVIESTVGVVEVDI